MSPCHPQAIHAAEVGVHKNDGGAAAAADQLYLLTIGLGETHHPSDSHNPDRVPQPQRFRSSSSNVHNTIGRESMAPSTRTSRLVTLFLLLAICALVSSFYTAPARAAASAASLLPFHRQHKNQKQRHNSILARLSTTRGGVAGKVKEVQTLEETEAALGEAGSKLVVLDFTATWCGPCKLISPVFEALSEEISTNEAVFLKVDVDVNEGTARKFEVFQMPTFVFVKDGEVKGRLVGANPDKLREAVFRFL